MSKSGSKLRQNISAKDAEGVLMRWTKGQHSDEGSNGEAALRASRHWHVQNQEQELSIFAINLT